MAATRSNPSIVIASRPVRPTVMPFQQGVVLVMRIGWIVVFGLQLIVATVGRSAGESPFGSRFPKLDSHATGEWWKTGGKQGPRLMVPRDQVLAFALYTHDHGVLKLTAQLYPLLPDEPREVSLELKRGGRWQVVATESVLEPGFSAHFRVSDWNANVAVSYRLRHGAKAHFTGLIRRDPIDKPTIVVGVLSCNSSRTPGPRPRIVENLLQQDPDLLFFAGDQSYHHRQHTFGWLEFGAQFREVLRNRPVITIPDDHDVGQANIWGESGKVAQSPAGNSGGYFFPVEYVNMVQRCQTWHLPDAYDATPIQRGIGVYYTRLRVGGIDFAILEDRKFKTGPAGKIPRQGPRPDHITDPDYDRSSVDVPGLKLLGDRQLQFLQSWGEDWSGTTMKCVLSQTAFCGAVHLHGRPENRLLADLDCNGWPQTPRNHALRAIRRAWAPHLCGDQHLAVVVQHGIDQFRDGPVGFTCPAMVNTIYGRWWRPLNDRPGNRPLEGSRLPWTGDYRDGLGNRLTMMAYANPVDRRDPQQRADGYGIVRFHKPKQTVTIECWPRFADVRDGDAAQFPGWPIRFKMRDNDGRKPVGWLPEIVVKGVQKPVVQVVEEMTSEVLYTIRVQGKRWRAPVYQPGTYRLNVGRDHPRGRSLSGLRPLPRDAVSRIEIDLEATP